MSRACDLPRPRCAALAAGKYPSPAHSRARVLSSARFQPRGRVPRTKRLYAARRPPIAEPAQGIWWTHREWLIMDPSVFVSNEPLKMKYRFRLRYGMGKKLPRILKIANFSRLALLCGRFVQSLELLWRNARCAVGRRVEQAWRQ